MYIHIHVCLYICKYIHRPTLYVHPFRTAKYPGVLDTYSAQEHILPARTPQRPDTKHARSRMSRCSIHMRPCTHASAGARASAHASQHRRRRTGGGGGAQQLCVRGAGADRVGIEVRFVGAGVVVAALREIRSRLPERRIRGLSRGGGGGAARRLGRDPHGARRALVAARISGHVRACARQHRTRGPRPCRRSCAPM
jgi:hypothetical protein